MNNEVKKELLQASSTVAIAINKALANYNGRCVELSIDDASNILLLTGTLTKMVLSGNLPQPAPPEKDPNAESKAFWSAVAEEDGYSLDRAYAPGSESPQEVIEDAPAPNLPSKETMRRAIQAASEANAAASKKDSQKSELITGVTGTTSGSTRNISAANMLRNAELQERALQILQKTPGAQPFTGFKVRPAGAPKQEVASVAEKAPQPAPSILPKPAPAPVQRSVRIAPQEPPVAEQLADVIMDAGAVAPPEPVDLELPPEPNTRPISERPVIVRENGYVPAIGAQRDTKTNSGRFRQLFAKIPDDEMLAGATARDQMPVFPGTKDMRPPSPYERLTDASKSEFAKIFAPSAFTPDCKGVVTLDTPGYPWNKTKDLEVLPGKDLPYLHQGFYGYNSNNHGPAYVVLRLARCLVIWNFNHTQNNCRIFYIGRSNLTGLWYPPEAMDRDELLRVAFELNLHAQKEEALAKGQTFIPPAMIL